MSRDVTYYNNTNNRGEDPTHGHHQMVNTEIRLIIFFFFFRKTEMFIIH